jgi:Flp pilus assembly protein TadD
MKKAIYLQPLSSIINFNMGLVYYRMQQFTAAFHFFLTTVNLEPNNAKAFMYLGLTLDELEDPGNAYSSFLKAIKIEPTDPEIQLNCTIFLTNHQSYLQ